MAVICSKCGKKIAPASPFWKLSIRLWGEDGGVPASIHRPGHEIDTLIEAIVDRVQLMDSDMLEKQVYQEFSFVLCKECRDVFSANPLNNPL